MKYVVREVEFDGWRTLTRDEKLSVFTNEVKTRRANLKKMAAEEQAFDSLEVEAPKP